jgi:hypothetical protein
VLVPFAYSMSGPDCMNSPHRKHAPSVEFAEVLVLLCVCELVNICLREAYGLRLYFVFCISFPEYRGHAHV